VSAENKSAIFQYVSAGSSFSRRESAASARLYVTSFPRLIPFDFRLDNQNFRRRKKIRV
jgi:hypothetical protein